MNCRNYYFVLGVGVLLGQASAASAQEVKKEFKLLINAPDEAVAKQVSLAKAADFLDHHVRTVFELIRLQRICEIFDTKEQAVAAFQSSYGCS